MQENIHIISSIKDRILQYIDYLGITKYKFYKITGISRGVLDLKSGLSEENITKFIVAFPEVNLEWVILGKGPIDKTKNNEILSISGPSIEAKGYVNKQNIIKTLPLLQEASPNNYTKNSLKLFIPYLPSPNFSFITHEPDLSQFETYNIPGLRDADFLMQYYGDNMHPFVSAGNIIAGKIVKKVPLYTWGRVHIFELEEVGVVLGRLRPGSVEGNVRCEPDNPEFQSIEFPIENIIAIAMLMAVIKIL